MIAKYIDWGPFFQTWDLPARIPQILDDAVVGEQARKVFAEAQKMLERASSRAMAARPTASIGLFPANSVRRRHRDLRRRARASACS